MDKEAKIQKRREDRQQALEFVYERMFRDDSTEDLYEDAFHARDAQVSDYAREIVEGVESHAEEIDALIESRLKGWKLNRISKMSLAVMRVAVYEMKYIKSVPVSVSINEAVNLAKSYSTDKDGSFVNGVLGAVAKTLKGDK